MDIFDDQNNRLSVKWQGFEFNGNEEAVAAGATSPTYGVWLDHVTYNTPWVFQSEAHPDIVKGGGGLELYNPRVASRVLDMRGRILAESLARIGAIKQELQKLFSPLYLQWIATGSWPAPNGRIPWTDPWSSEYLPLTFSRMNDGHQNSALATAFPTGIVTLQHSVFPLGLPDPAVHSVQQGYSADFNVQFLVLDGGIAIARTASSRTGSGELSVTWGEIPVWPQISFTMSGAGSATFTLAVSGVTDYSPTNLVLDLSGRSNGQVIKINSRERKVYVNNVETGLWVSGDYPVVASKHDLATFTFSNTTNCGTITTSWYEALPA